MEIPVIHEITVSPNHPSRRSSSSTRSTVGGTGKVLSVSPNRNGSSSSGVDSHVSATGSSSSANSFLRLSRTSPGGRPKQAPPQPPTQYKPRITPTGKPLAPPPPRPGSVKRSGPVTRNPYKSTSALDNDDDVAPSRLSGTSLTSSLQSSSSSAYGSSSSPSSASSSASSTLRGLHVRLPSTDSGIQADAGFDSLSRYKGRSFLNSSLSSSYHEDSQSRHGHDDTLDKSRESSVFSSSGYGTDVTSGDRLKATSPLSFSPSRVDQVSSPSFRSLPGSPDSTLPRQRDNHVNTLPRQRENHVTTIRTSVGSTPQSKTDSPSRPSVLTRPTRPAPDIPKSPLSPSSAASSSSSFSFSSRRSDTKAPFSTSSSVKVVTSPDGEVIVSFGENDFPENLNFSNDNVSIKNRQITISPTSSGASTPRHRMSRPASTRSSVDLDTTLDSTSTSGRTSPIILTANAGSTVCLDVKADPSRSSTPEQTQKTQNQSQLQGGIALTRPLKISNPSRYSVRAVQPTTLNSHSDFKPSKPVFESHPTTVKQQQQSIQQSQQQQKPSITRLKPQTSPRSIFLASSSKAGSSLSSADMADSSSTSQAKKPSLPAKPFTSPKPDTFSKTEIPVVHSIKSYRNSPRLVGRKEIPVRHLGLKDRNIGLGHDLAFSNSSLRDKTSHKLSPIDRIYENVNLLRDGFKFEDEKSKEKHDELVSKHSNDLINDALFLFGNSNLDTKRERTPLKFGNSPKIEKRRRTTSGGSESVDENARPIGERVVEGSDSECVIPVLDMRTGKLHKDGKVCNNAGDDSRKEGALLMLNKNGETSWSERKERMDNALSWLKSQLADLRAMDTTLISQFKRCQDTIETLKTQRDFWEGLCEEGEEADYWDDYEINEFNRRNYLDSPGGSTSSQLSYGSRDPSLQDVTSLTLPVPPPHLATSATESGNSGSFDRGRRGSVTQDVEATL